MCRPQKIAFIGGFLALIYGVPIYQGAAELAKGRRPQILDLFTALPTRANLRAFERQLEDSSTAAQAVRPWMQLAWYASLENAGETVLVGRDGWLFYKPDLRYLVEPPAPAEDPLAAILKFRAQLAERGIRLMVLPTPGKPSLYPEKLSGTLDGVRQTHSPTLQLIAELRRAGIVVPDLFALFAQVHGQARSSSWYLMRDTHWSGEAARLAAEMVARRILETGSVEQGTVDFAEREVVAHRRSDIARMMRAPEVERRFPAESVPCFQVYRRDSGELYRDDPESPVLVMGDSFLRIYETDEPRAAGFIAHLARALKRPVASLVNDGGASTLVRQELSRRAGLLRGKKLVIWEFVERDLRFGTEGWKDVPLPPVAATLARR